MLLNHILELVKNDWNFTPHMAGPCQSVRLGRVSLSEWSSNLQLDKKIVAITQLSSLILQMMMLDLTRSTRERPRCKLRVIGKYMAAIHAYTYLSNVGAFGLVEVVQSGQRFKWDIATGRDSDHLTRIQVVQLTRIQGKCRPFARCAPAQIKWNAVVTQMVDW